jgi:hypothetical protein
MHHLRRRNLVTAAPILAALAALPALRGTFRHDWLRFQVLSQHSLQVIGQNGGSDENEVSTDEIEKYVSVYKAMQRNRNLTVDQAAAAQGLTTQQFRQLEDRVQRDDAALQQARVVLQAAAKASPPAGESPVPTHH